MHGARVARARVSDVAVVTIMGRYHKGLGSNAVRR